MKKLLLATAAGALAAGAATAQSDDSSEPVKLGIILGYTGPIESLAPNMATAAELAIDEINESGNFLGGRTLEGVRADSTCIDNAAATAAAERLISDEGISAIVGADCSGVTGAVLSNVAVPQGVPMVSPSATSPALSTAEDNGLFFRTAPSDARQGDVLANIVMDKGIEEVAVTYVNSDYGQGLADSFTSSYEELGGTVTYSASHEDNRADYSAEVAAADAAGGEALVVLGYADGGGRGMIQSSLDTGAFDTFIMGDGMFADSLTADLGDMLEGSFGAVPWSEGEGADAFQDVSSGELDSTFTRESYDAAALLALAMQAGGEPSSEAITSNMMDIANEPGEQILPGELGRGLELLANGEEIDYVGATNVELIGPGEASGTYREYEITGGDYETVSFR